MEADARARLRRSLLQLVSLLVMTLVAVLLLALFSLWSLNRAHERAEADTTARIGLLDETRRVQVAFKLQVQEWKNLLVRGGDAARRAQYRDAFERVSAEVDAGLTGLAARLADDDLGAAAKEAQALAIEHRRLAALYAESISLAEASWDPGAIDARVRGIDRPLNDAMDALADRLRDRLLRDAAERQALLRERYDATSAFLWGAAGVAVLLIGLLLWRVLRDPELTGRHG